MKKYYLKFWRMKEEMTQAQVAARLGISAGHYKAVENGVFKPSPAIINKFCHEFTDGSEEMRKAVESTLFEVGGEDE